MRRKNCTSGYRRTWHEAPDLEDDYCEYEDGELEEIAEEPEDEDTPPWEEDTEE